MKVLLTQKQALSVAWEAKQLLGQPTEEEGGTGGVLPDTARDWLAALRLGEGVPFQYLVLDDRLLPAESIRFFYLDRNWTDAERHRHRHERRSPVLPGGALSIRIPVS